MNIVELMLLFKYFQIQITSMKKNMSINFVLLPVKMKKTTHLKRYNFSIFFENIKFTLSFYIWILNDHCNKIYYIKDFSEIILILYSDCFQL